MHYNSKQRMALVILGATVAISIGLYFWQYNPLDAPRLVVVESQEQASEVSLETTYIVVMNTTEAILASIPRTNAIKEAEVRDTRLSNGTIQELAKLPHLKEVRFVKCSGFVVSDISMLNDSTTLQSVIFISCPDVDEVTLSRLAKRGVVKDIWVIDCPLVDASSKVDAPAGVSVSIE